MKPTPEQWRRWEKIRRLNDEHERAAGPEFVEPAGPDDETTEERNARYREAYRQRERLERAEILMVVDDLALLEDKDSTFLARVTPCMNGGYVGPDGRRFVR